MGTRRGGRLGTVAMSKKKGGNQDVQPHVRGAGLLRGQGLRPEQRARGEEKAAEGDQEGEERSYQGAAQGQPLPGGGCCEGEGGRRRRARREAARDPVVPGEDGKRSEERWPGWY